MKNKTFPITVIGRVERPDTDPELRGADAIEALRAERVTIRVEPAFTEGLLGLEPGDDILVLYYLHQSSGHSLQLHPRGDPTRELRGVFATRSPNRPTPIAVTSGRVERVEDNILTVTGLDALDGSPVLDIKPYAESFDSPYEPPEDPNQQ